MEQFMKFKEQRGNVFVFDVDGCELECETIHGGYAIEYRSVVVETETGCVWAGCSKYKDIQTAVQMMQILIDRGLV